MALGVVRLPFAFTRSFSMSIDRRRLFAAIAGAGAAGTASEAQSMPARDAGPRAEIDATSFGLRPLSLIHI